MSKRDIKHLGCDLHTCCTNCGLEKPYWPLYPGCPYKLVNVEKGKRLMPIIKITDDAINRSKSPDSGWHLGKIQEFHQEDSKDKKSTNWIFDIVIVSEGDNAGRYAFARFNSKAAGMLVGTGFLPAALDQPINAGIEFNPEELITKELYIEVGDKVYEGKIQKEIKAYAPASAPPF